MPFVNVPGLKGKVYVPDQDPDTPKKNPCPDCFSCQMCAENRCHVCLRQKGHKHACKCNTSETPGSCCKIPPDTKDQTAQNC
jgi:hypothetical protein